MLDQSAPCWIRVHHVGSEEGISKQWLWALHPFTLSQDQCFHSNKTDYSVIVTQVWAYTMMVQPSHNHIRRKGLKKHKQSNKPKTGTEFSTTTSQVHTVLQNTQRLTPHTPLTHLLYVVRMYNVRTYVVVHSDTKIVLCVHCVVSYPQWVNLVMVSAWHLGHPHCTDRDILLFLFLMTDVFIWSPFG